MAERTRSTDGVAMATEKHEERNGRYRELGFREFNEMRKTQELNL